MWSKKITTYDIFLVFNRRMFNLLHGGRCTRLKIQRRGLLRFFQRSWWGSLLFGQNCKGYTILRFIFLIAQADPSLLILSVLVIYQVTEKSLAVRKRVFSPVP